MKIRFLTGDKKGQIAHAPVNQNTQLMVDAGLIEVLPWKNYQERLAAEMAALPKPVVTVSWGVRHVTAPGELQPRNVIVVKTVNTGDRCDETTYAGPPADCPPAVVAKFRKESAVYEQIRADRKHAEKVRADRA